jgi:hypothetical protein
MSTRQIPYPPDFDVNYHADLAEQRRQRVLKTLAVSDVLTEVDDLIAQEPDPTKHPAHDVVAFLGLQA